jgi:hypothetical protein
MSGRSDQVVETPIEVVEKSMPGSLLQKHEWRTAKVCVGAQPGLCNSSTRPGGVGTALIFLRVKAEKRKDLCPARFLP